MISLGLQRQFNRQTEGSPAHSENTSTATIHSLALGRAACINRKQPRARAALALLGDKKFIFSTSGKSFLMYRRSGRCFVSMGDPVGLDIERVELIKKLSALAKAENGWPVFYQVESNSLELYENLDLSCKKIGEEAVVSLTDFTLEGSKKSRLRQTLRRAERDGATFEIIPPRAAGPLMDELRSVSDSWLNRKNTREKGFSLGAFEPSYLLRCPIAVVNKNDKIVAFANIWKGNSGGELGVDMMRYSPDAPYGVMEYLFVKMLLWGREQGYSKCSLGMAPLAGLEDQASTCLWSRTGAAIYKHGERFYNFRGVREYKKKFSPQWESRYLASPDGVLLPISIAAISTLIAGGARGLIAR